MFFFFSSRRRHTSCGRDWSSDVCSSDLLADRLRAAVEELWMVVDHEVPAVTAAGLLVGEERQHQVARRHSALPAHLPHEREDHRVEVLHVDGAATPEVSVLDLA